ncbi:MAG: VirB4 family type IV secretion system protein [Bacilli bacterium]
MFGRRTKAPRKKVYHDNPGVLGENAPTLHDLMTVASGLSVQSSEIYLSPSGYTKCYYVTGLPSRIRFQYLQRFFFVGADVHVSLHVDPADSVSAIAKRNKMMTRLEAEMIREQKAGTNKAVSFYQGQYDLLEQEREMLRLGQERLFLVTIVFAVSSPDRDEFVTACERIEREGFEGFVIRDAYMEHDIGLKTVAPIGYNALRHPIEMTASALANAFPFTNSHFSHEYGVPIGTDFTTGHLNRYDAWHPRLENANAVIIGVAGAGKSFLLKGLNARSAAFNIRHAIVDYEGEYAAVVHALGGVSIRISESSSHKFNPFEIEEEEITEADGSIHRTVDVKEKIAEMERLVRSMVQLHANDPMDGYQSAVVNDLMQDLYESQFGFTSDPSSLYEQKTAWERDRKSGDRLVSRVKRPQPQFSDFYESLSQKAEDDPRLQELVMRLRRFRAAGTEGMFDCQSNVQLQDVPVIHFDLSTLPEKSSARLLGMQVILEWIIEKFVKKNPKLRKRVVVDEAQKMLDNEEHARFIEDVFRRIRKRSGSAVAATQDFRKFAENEHGRAIIQNAATRVLLKQSKLDKEALMSQFGLEDSEFEELIGYTDGQSRWTAGGEVFYNQLIASADEVELFNTRFVQAEGVHLR